MQKITAWVKNNRLEAFLLALILLTAAFLRLYKIDEYMTFLGDEGRDALIVRRLLVNFDPILIGPGTSIGNMYLGPLYYYLIAPFLFLSNFSPVGPSVMVAILGVVTVYMVWHITKEWFVFGSKPKTKKFGYGALIAATLYAVSPVVVTYSRSSWNPNVMPFFTLLSLYSIWRVYKYLEFKWLVVSGIAFAFVLNTHYLGLLLVPVLIIYFCLTIYKLRVNSLKDKKLSSNNSLAKEQGKFVKYSLIGLFVFVLLMSPLAIFDARHNWVNAKALNEFITVRQTTVSIKPWSSIPKLIPLSEKITGRLITGMEASAAKPVFYSIMAISLLLILKNLKNIFSSKVLASNFLILFLWLSFSLIGLGLYKQEIYDHYYGFFFPAPFMLLGGLSQKIADKFKLFGVFFLLLTTSYLILVNLQNSHLKYPPNNQVGRSSAVAKEIEIESQGRDFNLAVIAERNYEGAYQYFLEKDNAPIVMIDSQLFKETVKDQLFVVCELPKEKCDPTHNPKAGIANFGWSKIASEKEINGVILYKLVHTQ